MKKLLVRFDAETTLINGYFMKGANYNSNSINENDIDGYPFIEIESVDQIVDKQMCVVDGFYQEHVKPDSVLLEEAKYSKKQEVEDVRAARFVERLFVKNIDNKPYYASVHPELNIFEASSLTDEFMIDSDKQPILDANGDKIINSVLWGCYVEGEKELISLTKKDLDNLAKHYKDRKGAAYNQCDLARAAIKKLTTLKEVEAFDITKIY